MHSLIQRKIHNHDRRPDHHVSPSTTTENETTPKDPQTRLYSDKILVSKSNTPNGQVSPLTRFHYHQSADGKIVWAEYAGGSIVKGVLVGTVTLSSSSSSSSSSPSSASASRSTPESVQPDQQPEQRENASAQPGMLNMRYSHVDIDGELKTGRCISTPEVLEDGRLRLYERWVWTCGDGGEGESVVEEVLPGDDRAGGVAGVDDLTDKIHKTSIEESMEWDHDR